MRRLDCIFGAACIRFGQILVKGQAHVDIFTVAESDFKKALELVRENKDVIGYDEVMGETNVAKVSIVGAGMLSSSGIASTMFEALSDAGINIQMISTSEIKVSVLIDEYNADQAVQVIHNKFFN